MADLYFFWKLKVIFVLSLILLILHLILSLLQLCFDSAVYFRFKHLHSLDGVLHHEICESGVEFSQIIQVHIQPLPTFAY